jgi:hypothetical protein
LVWKNNLLLLHRMTVAIVKPHAGYVIVGMGNVFITEQLQHLFHQLYPVKFGNL